MGLIRFFAAFGTEHRQQVTVWLLQRQISRAVCNFQLEWIGLDFDKLDGEAVLLSVAEQVDR